MKNLVFKISVIDKISKPLTNIQKSFDKTQKSVINTQKSFRKSFNNIKGRLNTLPNSIAQIEHKLERLRQKQKEAFNVRDIMKYQRAIKKTGRELQKLENKKFGGRVNAATKNLTNNIKQSFGGFVAGGMIYGAFSGLKQIVSLSAQMEQTKVAFTTMLGSGTKANDMINQLNDFANKTPFDNTELYKASKLMLNFGVAQEKVLPYMRMLGDVSGGNADKMQSLTLAFSQIQSQGKLMGQDLMQMINAGFNPLQELSQMTGKSMAQLKDEMSKGAISADMVTSAFKHATGEGGRFHNMMSKQSNTLAGQFSTIVGSIKLVAVQIGNSLMPSLKKISNVIVKFVGYINEHKGIAKAIGKGILGIVAVLAIWIPLQWALNAALSANPIGLIIMGIVALTAGIAYLIINIRKVFDAWKKVRLIMLMISPVLAIVIDGILKVFKLINYVVKYGFDGLKLWLQELLNDAIGIINKIITGINKATGTSIKMLPEFHWIDKTVLDKQRNDKKENSKSQDFLSSVIPNGSGANILGNGNSDVTGGGGNLDNTSNIDAITGGGSKPTNITINLGKFFDNLNISSDNFDENIDQMQSKVEEALLRVLNSANAISNG